MLQIKEVSLLSVMCLVISSTLAIEVPSVHNILNFVTGDFFTHRANKTKGISQMSPEELGLSRGKSTYDFIDLLTNRYGYECAPDDHYILHLLPKRSGAIHKRPIVVKCLPLTSLSPDNETVISNIGKLQMIDNVKDVVALLKPIGNTKKRDEYGSCVLIYFYTATSLGCSLVAANVNKLPLLYPSIRIAAIDAHRITNFNTEFGIVGVPTLLLFHQGRPIVKFYSDERTYERFITRHTGIQPAEQPKEDIIGPLRSSVVQRIDYYLVLAWAFILLCAGNYFAKSAICQQLVEMIKRNWRESEAQLEHN